MNVPFPNRLPIGYASENNSKQSLMGQINQLAQWWEVSHLWFTKLSILSYNTRRDDFSAFLQQHLHYKRSYLSKSNSHFLGSFLGFQHWLPIANLHFPFKTLLIGLQLRSLFKAVASASDSVVFNQSSTVHNNCAWWYQSHVLQTLFSYPQQSFVRRREHSWVMKMHQTNGQPFCT